MWRIFVQTVFIVIVSIQVRDSEGDRGVMKYYFLLNHRIMEMNSLAATPE